MPNFSDAQISKWANNYERELCSKYDLIVDRFSFDITEGVQEYEIPNYCTNIRAILWKGKEVYPKDFTKSVATRDTPLTTVGQIYPLEYIYNALGAKIIKFMPAPSESVAEYTSDLFTPTADENAVIMEFYRTPHLTDIDLKIPTWARRYLLKDYICLQGFKTEGPKQDLKGAKYYTAKMAQGQAYIRKIKTNMTMGYLNVLSSKPSWQRGRPGRPVYPDNFSRRG